VADVAKTCWVMGFAVICEGSITWFGLFTVQLFKACASVVGHRRRLNDGFRLPAVIQSWQRIDRCCEHRSLDGFAVEQLLCIRDRPVRIGLASGDQVLRRPRVQWQL
jgi:hypothetical protein